MALIERVLETCLYVDDIERAEEFYQNVFELTTYAKEEGRHVFFKLADGMLLLFNPAETRNGGSIPAHGATGAGHVAFVIQHDELEIWKERLQSHDIEIEKEYTWPSGGRSLYFRDPFNNSLELGTEDIWP